MVLRKASYCLIQSSYLSGIVESRNTTYESQWVADECQCNAKAEGEIVLVVTHSVAVESLGCSDWLLLHEIK